MHCLVIMLYKTTIIRTVRYLDEPNRTINITEQKDQKQTQVIYLVYDNDCVSISEKEIPHARTFG